MFYEDYNGPTHHVEAISTDGVHFTRAGHAHHRTGWIQPTRNPSWGDMAYDPATGYWYAGFNLPNSRSVDHRRGARSWVSTASSCTAFRTLPF